MLPDNPCNSLFHPSLVCYEGIMTKLTFLACAACLLVAACSKTPPPDPAWLAEVETWRATRLASLTREDGWLTLVGLHWLEPGRHRLGSAPEAEVYLEGEEVPPEAGTLEVTADGRVLLHPVPGSGLLVNGQPAAAGELTTEGRGAPSLLSLGALRMVVIQRGDRLALRVRNPDSPVRKNFSGLQYFPLDLRYRVEGQLERYPAPRTVQVPVAQGPPQSMLAPGVVHFNLGGQKLSLVPLISSPGDPSFFFVFRDATSGGETYGAGRFLEAAAPPEESTSLVLDFNRAYTPPCAFTPYATCPLPPPENVLPMAIRAGEKGYGQHRREG